MTKINELLRNRRKELNLTMYELSQKVGVSEGTISRWESGNIENMRRDKLVLLAMALEISPSVIMGWEFSNDTHNAETEERRTEIEIGRKIKGRRNELNMTLEQLATVLGFNKSTMQRYETGKISKIKLPVIQAIATALKVTPEWLMGLDVPKDDISIGKDTEKLFFVNSLTPEENQLISNYNKLNNIGKEKILDLMEDLLSLDKYTAADELQSKLG